MIILIIELSLLLIILIFLTINTNRARNIGSTTPTSISNKIFNLVSQTPINCNIGPCNNNFDVIQESVEKIPTNIDEEVNKYIILHNSSTNTITTNSKFVMMSNTGKILCSSVGLDFWGEGRDDINKTGGYSFLNLNLLLKLDETSNQIRTDKKLPIPNFIPINSGFVVGPFGTISGDADYSDSLTSVKTYCESESFNRIVLMGSPLNGCSGLSSGNDAESINYLINKMCGVIIIYGGYKDNTIQNLAEKLPDFTYMTCLDIEINPSNIICKVPGNPTVYLEDDYGSSITQDKVITIFYLKNHVYDSIIVTNTGLQYFCKPNFDNSCQNCITGYIKCGNDCVDTLNDNKNCGTCGLTCVNSSGCLSGKCVCNADWTGTKCDSKVCSGHGTMNTKNGSCNCDTNTHWGGNDCSVCPPNYNSTCTDCVAPYVLGTNCTRSRTDCNNHGTPSSSGSGTDFVCSCDPFTSGDRCQIVCSGHGAIMPNTSDPGGSNYCACANNWTGTLCETCNVGYLQDGTCTKCDNVNGYYGSFCQNKCNCGNTKVCLKFDSGPRCVCKNGWLLQSPFVANVTYPTILGIYDGNKQYIFQFTEDQVYNCILNMVNGRDLQIIRTFNQGNNDFSGIEQLTNGKILTFYETPTEIGWKDNSSTSKFYQLKTITGPDGVCKQ